MNLPSTVLFGTLLLAPVVPLQAANECAGTPWRSSSASCADLGLHSDYAVCLGNRRHALMCDDARGRIRTCTSAIRCDNRHGYADEWRHPRKDDRRGHRGNRHGPRHADRGHRGDAVYFHGRWRACQVLRFDRRGRAVGYCPRGSYNRDCRRGCEY